MKNVALIPVRGGSKSIPLKNIKNLCGMPLVYWVAKAASECKWIDNVFISTDSDEIKDEVSKFSLDKLFIINRSAMTATDYASTESVMLEFAKNYEFENIVLVQATSPLLTSNDLDNGFEVFQEREVDSVLSVVRQKRFFWSLDEKTGLAYPTNYDVFHRPRRQNFDGNLVENGAFYITSKKLLVESKNRISGNIKAVEMGESSFWEIDEPSDWDIIELLMQQKRKKDSKTQRKNIKLFLTDCDGCLTDGGMYYSEYGDELKKFHTRDGMGFNLLKKNGIKTGIITGEKVNLNNRRAKKMKLDYLISGCENKLEAVVELCKENKIMLENVAYVGDDINDLETIKRVGVGCCVADAVEEVQQNACYVSKRRGGEGAVREIIDYILSEETF